MTQYVELILYFISKVETCELNVGGPDSFEYLTTILEVCLAVAFSTMCLGETIYFYPFMAIHVPIQIFEVKMNSCVNDTIQLFISC